MPEERKSRITKKGYRQAIINQAIINNVDRDHSNDPFVVKKLKTAKAFLRKNGLPDHLEK
jgi:hypothetical protein